jgi:hypothetical protein
MPLTDDEVSSDRLLFCPFAFKQIGVTLLASSDVWVE